MLANIYKKLFTENDRVEHPQRKSLKNRKTKKSDFANSQKAAARQFYTKTKNNYEYNVDAIAEHMDKLSPSQKVQASLFLFGKDLQGLSVDKARELFVKNLPDPEDLYNDEDIKMAVEKEIKEEKAKWNIQDRELENMDDDSFLKFVSKKVDEDEGSSLKAESIRILSDSENKENRKNLN
ncbi:hypothetical protein MHBO_000651 [Bonamia ostreae]|uniref:Uncharacterized protein n=1 Tax=Bonamia ostreae TaxID=126728 RepID=A0ABV2AGC1_9EUKA